MDVAPRTVERRSVFRQITNHFGKNWFYRASGSFVTLAPIVIGAAVAIYVHEDDSPIEYVIKETLFMSAFQLGLFLFSLWAELDYVKDRYLFARIYNDDKFLVYLAVFAAGSVFSSLIRDIRSTKHENLNQHLIKTFQEISENQTRLNLAKLQEILELLKEE
ncbi:uncharacterized protein IL334_005262 [Kwoniella shivajii]|uniref:Uncharacterized protein n=1 Tax=Kwoniella shivajii TaxID=564305 RepID=A0ABZ1D5N2_9TREE|nr:hypothetical protein IL334_005262 [Kwoniella shivajii]